MEVDCNFSNTCFIQITRMFLVLSTPFSYLLNKYVLNINYVIISLGDTEEEEIDSLINRSV